MMSHTNAQNSGKDLVFSWTERRSGSNKTPRSGEIRAKSENHALHQLRKQGVRHVKLKKVRSNTLGGIPAAVISAFVRQLAVMIQSGVPLNQSLGLIAGSMTSRSKRSMAEVVRVIRADVESGMKLSDAMRKHPRCFDALFCNTLAAGEQAGELDSSLDRLATYMEKSVRIRQKVRKAMIYPSIVVGVALAVTVGMLLYVLPTFKSVYSQAKAELPGLTATLLGLSDTLQHHGLIVFIGIILGGYSFLQVYKRHPKFRNTIDNIVLRLPVFGELLHTATHARWTRTFSTLSASGVPITNALEAVAAVSSIQAYRDATLAVRQGVASGSRVSDGLEKFPLFPPETVQMIRIGEESGRLDGMLERLADQYEVKLDDQVDTLSTIMEPMIMIVVGSLIGVLIIGMYLPIFNMGGIL